MRNMNIGSSNRIIFIVLLTGILSACVSPILITGEKSDPIPLENVRLYYAQRPDCSYDTIGHLRITGGYYSRFKLFRAMKRQAASVGADGVYVHESRQLDILEYIGTASAIRCHSG